MCSLIKKPIIVKIGSWLDNMPSKWKKILDDHPLTQRVLPFQKVRMLNGRVTQVRGLTDAIKKTFCPKFKRTKGTRKPSSSKRLGTKVHAQVEAWAKGKPPKRMHAYAKAIVDYLEKNKFKVIEAEGPLLSPSGKFLTHYDLLCEQKKELVMVSLKTGYNQAFKRGKNLCRFIPSLKDSYHTQHQLQLGLEMQCLQTDYGIPVKRGIVIYSGFGVNKKLRVEKQASWIENTDLLKFMGSGRKKKAN